MTHSTLSDTQCRFDTNPCYTTLIKERQHESDSTYQTGAFQRFFDPQLAESVDVEPLGMQG